MLIALHKQATTTPKIFVRIYPAQTAANARRFLRDLERAAPMKITRVLADNGKAFTHLFKVDKPTPKSSAT